jgi:hypothetical protein
MERLSTILRDAIQPLYSNLLNFALDYALTVTTAVLDTQVDAAHHRGEVEVQHAWEGLQNALISGIIVRLNAEYIMCT